jgi:hypothetical protein
MKREDIPNSVCCRETKARTLDLPTLTHETDSPFYVRTALGSSGNLVANFNLVNLARGLV